MTLLPKLNETAILSPFKYISEAHPEKKNTTINNEKKFRSRKDKAK